jgi:hypothetical protein
MLDVEPPQNLIDIAWEQVEVKTRLPNGMGDFFDSLGMMPHASGCRRAYQRFFLRARAILRWQDETYGVYSADASRHGLRFLSPVEMPLSQRARIRLPNTKEFQIEIVRCHRIDDECFDCGAIFVLGTTG